MNRAASLQSVGNRQQMSLNTSPPQPVSGKMDLSDSDTSTSEDSDDDYTNESMNHGIISSDDSSSDDDNPNSASDTSRKDAQEELHDLKQQEEVDAEASKKATKLSEQIRNIDRQGSASTAQLNRVLGVKTKVSPVDTATEQNTVDSSDISTDSSDEEDEPRATKAKTTPIKRSKSGKEGYVTAKKTIQVAHKPCGSSSSEDEDSDDSATYAGDDPDNDNEADPAVKKRWKTIEELQKMVTLKPSPCASMIVKECIGNVLWCNQTCAVTDTTTQTLRENTKDKISAECESRLAKLVSVLSKRLPITRAYTNESFTDAKPLTGQYVDFLSQFTKQNEEDGDNTEVNSQPIPLFAKFGKSEHADASQSSSDWQTETGYNRKQFRRQAILTLTKFVKQVAPSPSNGASNTPLYQTCDAMFSAASESGWNLLDTQTSATMYTDMYAEENWEFDSECGCYKLKQSADSALVRIVLTCAQMGILELFATENDPPGNQFVKETVSKHGVVDALMLAAIGSGKQNVTAAQLRTALHEFLASQPMQTEKGRINFWSGNFTVDGDEAATIASTRMFYVLAAIGSASFLKTTMLETIYRENNVYYGAAECYAASYFLHALHTEASKQSRIDDRQNCVASVIDDIQHLQFPAYAPPHTNDLCAMCGLRDLSDIAHDSLTQNLEQYNINDRVGRTCEMTVEPKHMSRVKQIATDLAHTWCGGQRSPEAKDWSWKKIGRFKDPLANLFMPDMLMKYYATDAAGEDRSYSLHPFIDKNLRSNIISAYNATKDINKPVRRSKETAAINVTKVVRELLDLGYKQSNTQARMYSNVLKKKNKRALPNRSNGAKSIIAAVTKSSAKRKSTKEDASNTAEADKPKKRKRTVQKPPVSVAKPMIEDSEENIVKETVDQQIPDTSISSNDVQAAPVPDSTPYTGTIHETLCREIAAGLHCGDLKDVVHDYIEEVETSVALSSEHLFVGRSERLALTRLCSKLNKTRAEIYNADDWCSTNGINAVQKYLVSLPVGKRYKTIAMIAAAMGSVPTSE